MARINLLPWREKQKLERKQRFLAFLGLAAALAIGLGVLIHISIDALIDHQTIRNHFLTQHLTVLDKEITDIRSLEVEKAQLLTRMNVIQKLQYSRPEVVHLFEEMVTTLPDGVYLLKISQKEQTLNIEGVAESNSRISSLMRNMDRSPWLSDPELIVINSNTKDFPNASWFSLKVKRSRPNAEPG